MSQYQLGEGGGGPLPAKPRDAAPACSSFQAPDLGGQEAPLDLENPPKEFLSNPLLRGILRARRIESRMEAQVATDPEFLRTYFSA